MPFAEMEVFHLCLYLPATTMSQNSVSQDEEVYDPEHLLLPLFISHHHQHPCSLFLHLNFIYIPDLLCPSPSTFSPSPLCLVVHHLCFISTSSHNHVTTLLSSPSEPPSQPLYRNSAPHASMLCHALSCPSPAQSSSSSLFSPNLYHLLHSVRCSLSVAVLWLTRSKRR